MDVVIILLSPGISIPSEDIAKIVQGCTDITYLDQPNLISGMLLDPNDGSKFVSDEPIVDQCKNAILKVSADKEFRDTDRLYPPRCRIVWIVGESEFTIDSPDGIGVISLFSFCAKTFTSKSMMMLTSGQVPTDISAYCFAHCYPLSSVNFKLSFTF